MASIIGDLLNTLGITNSGLATSTVVPRTTGREANEIAQTQFDKDSEIGDPNAWSVYSSRMVSPRSLDEMMQLWNEMSNWDLMAAALVEIVDETIQQDQTSGKALWYETSDEKLTDELNQLLDDIDIEDKLPSQVWHLAGYGNHFERIQYEPGEGVKGLSYASPMDVRRFWLKKNRKCVGFHQRGEKPDKTPLWQQGNQVVQRAAITGTSAKSKDDMADLWYPWDFLHFRRMYRLRVSEHGEPIFEEAQGIYKKLRMALDQMVVHRAQVQPDRYVIGVDTGTQPPLEQLKTIQRWKQSLRSKVTFGTGQSADTLSTPQDFQSFYNPLAFDTMFWLPRPTGFTHTVEKLAGTANVPDVYDIELLLNLFFSIIGMPRSWLGGQNAEGQNGPVSGKALLAQDIRFMRKVKSLRRPMLSSYTWLAYFHCVLKGIDIKDLDIRAKMSDIGTLEDQLKTEIFGAQVELLTKLGDFFDKYKLAPDAWLELLFKKYMHLPDELVNTVITALPPPIQVEDFRRQPTALERLRLSESRPSAEPAPASRVILAEVQQILRPHRRLVEHIKRLSKCLEEDNDITGHRLLEMQCQPHAIQPLPIKAGDEVVDEILETTPPTSSTPSSTDASQGISESVRRFIGR